MGETLETIVCSGCGKEFTFSAAQLRHRRNRGHDLFCSKPCSDFYHRGKSTVPPEIQAMVGRKLTKIELGKQYGNLTVLEQVENGGAGNDAYWKCRCDCGFVFSIRGACLRKGQTSCKSCARYRKRGSLDDQTKLIYKNYRKHAKERELEFVLSLDEFRDMIYSDCHYCGRAPANRWKKHQHRYNGVDRKNSSIGYKRSNCVPCCKVCNWMKRNYSIEDFAKHIGGIHKRRKQWAPQQYETWLTPETGTVSTLIQFLTK